MKILVAYFTGTGVTARAAKTLAAAAGAQLYEIRPAVPYVRADLNYMNKHARTTVEMADKSCRPEMADQDAPVANAEVVCIGFPIWWYREPSIIDTFLEAYDFSGKTVLPFFTSGGSDLGEGQERIEQLARGARVMPGKRFRGSAPEREFLDWLAGMGI